jgi:hypothetical protein
VRAAGGIGTPIPHPGERRRSRTLHLLTAGLSAAVGLGQLTRDLAQEYLLMKAQLRAPDDSDESLGLTKALLGGHGTLRPRVRQMVGYHRERHHHTPR